jgi:hypothetical protein
MQYRFVLLFMPMLLMLTACPACSDMYDNIDGYVSGEKVYSGFSSDTTLIRLGYERVEIDLLKAGRIPSSEIHWGRARQTVVEYDDEVIVIDSLCSWLDIRGLTKSKNYLFRIHTMDEYGNRSVPKEVPVIPYTRDDLESLSVISPVLKASMSTVTAAWAGGVFSSLFDCYGMTYSYTDRDSRRQTGEAVDGKFRVVNLNAGQQATVDIKYRIVPKMENVPILDTLDLEIPMTVRTLTEAEFGAFYPNRKIDHIDFLATQARVVWSGSVPGYCLSSEIKYVNKAGETLILPVANGTTTVNCPGAASPQSIWFRSSVLFEETGETLYGDWESWTFPELTLYAIGNAVISPALGSWQPANAIEMPFDRENPRIYVLETDLSAGQFHFLSQRGWEGYTVRPAGADRPVADTDCLAYQSGNDYAWRVAAGQAGKYRITVDLNRLKVEFLKLQ